MRTTLARLAGAALVIVFGGLALATRDEPPGRETTSPPVRVFAALDGV